MRYQFVEREKIRYRVDRLCRLLGVSRSGYYQWSQRKVTTRSVANERIACEIRQIYGEGRGEYGSPTVYHTLRERGFLVNRKRVVRLMRQMHLFAKTVKKFKHTTKRCPDHLASPNLLEQNFQVDEPNRVWVSDITFVRTEEGWLYLTAIKDLCTKRVVGYAITDDLRAEGVLEALRMALRHRASLLRPGLLFHSDRGKQFVDSRVRALLAEHKMVQSMSSTGNCYDNAPAESFFATLKKGHLFWEAFQTREEARRRLIEYIEIFYNCVRRHSSLGYKSPVAFELHQQAMLA